MTDKLMALQKQKKEVKKKEKGEVQSSPTGSVTNNNVFLGSVTDLQKHLISQTLEKNVTNAP